MYTMEKLISILTIYLLVPLTLLWAWSCTEQKQLYNDNYFVLAKSYYNIKNADGWKIDIASIDTSSAYFNTDEIYTGGFFQFKKYVSDTIYKMAFEYYTSKSDTLFYPLDYFKRYEDDDYQYILSLGENGDTLYFYKAFLFGDLHKKFISGKYYYQYIYTNLSRGQRTYFEQHRDSLTRIKGSRLPKLPE